MTTIDYWLMVSLGFLGSFGHCLGMCGPLSTALPKSNEGPHSDV
jgi:sulfite exporter TauE/SafE